jgi:tRNA uridine 5-carbamoylmethylation protein Kti12
MLCGIPGSGKTTLAAELRARLGEAEVVTADLVATRKGHYENLKQRLDEAADRQRYVILDGTFFRRELRDAVRAMGYPVVLAYLKCPLRVCLQRNEGRSEGIDSGGIILMHHRFEPPEEDEHPLVIHTERAVPSVTAALIREAVTRLEAGRRSRPAAGDSAGGPD